VRSSPIGGTVPVFLAQVELRFDAEDLEACGRRLNALAQMLRTEGVEVKGGRVEPALSTPSEDDGWIRYGPA
jgi:hypothetical protein